MPCPGSVEGAYHRCVGVTSISCRDRDLVTRLPLVPCTGRQASMLCSRAEIVVVACALIGGLTLPGLLLSLPSGPNVFFDRIDETGTVSERGSRTGELAGSVLLPIGRDERRRFRGRAYRERTNRAPRSSEEDPATSRERRFQNVIVSAHPLSFDTTAQALSTPVTIDQKEATFDPQVSPVTPGTTVIFVNSDPFYHNVFSLTPGARFNIGRRPTGVRVGEPMPRLENMAPGVGVIELHCDIHPQMNAFIVSVDTPYFARARSDGSFRLEGLPPGTYRVYGVMPRQDIVRYEVEVHEGERTSRTIDLR